MSDEPIQFPPLFHEIFGNLPRQGPGDELSTLRALAAVPHRERIKSILDMGCGAGTPTLVLARNTEAEIVAFDNHKPFLNKLQQNAKAENLDSRIRVELGDMCNPEFDPASFDLIWSEGAIASAGFEQGLTLWRDLLRDNGCVALTDLCWFTSDPPAEIHEYLTGFYPGMLSVDEGVQAFDRAGYRLLDHFALPKESWQTNYFNPLEAELVRQRSRYAGDPQALELLDMLQTEIDMYGRYSDHYGYEFFIAQKH
ncbi:MAG: class I SAM-dependent methyltransferase [Calditrichota bacterium]